MITEKDLQEEIAYRSGKLDPSTNDAVILASCQYLEDRKVFLKILETLSKRDESETAPQAYSLAAEPTDIQHKYSGASEKTIGEYGDSDFLLTVADKDPVAVWAIMDEHMQAMRAVKRRVYDDIMRKLRQI